MTNNRGGSNRLYSVLESLCIRCGSCSSLVPDVFGLAGSGVLKRQPTDAQERALCEAARINCPTNAIRQGDSIQLERAEAP